MKEHMKACMKKENAKRNRIDASHDKPNPTKRPMINSPETPSTNHSSAIKAVQEDANFDCSVEIASDDNYCNYDTKSNTTSLSGHDFPNFGVPTTDAYYRQDFQLFHDSGIEFGGFRGVCYRSRNENDLCHKDCISSVEDAKMMFYLTDLIKSNTADTNSLLYKVFHQIEKMCGTNFMDLGVRLPTNSNGGHKLFGGGALWNI